PVVRLGGLSTYFFPSALASAAPVVVVPDGSAVVYAAEQNALRKTELFRTRFEQEVSEGEDLSVHSADQNDDGRFSLGEIMRVIQLYNLCAFGCRPGTEDGFSPYEVAYDCAPHSSDYNPRNWRFELSEVLRAVQIYNSGSYLYCPEFLPSS